MSSSFPILPGSHPPFHDNSPPMENGFSDDDRDDFGNFTAVAYLATDPIAAVPDNEKSFVNFAEFSDHNSNTDIGVIMERNGTIVEKQLYEAEICIESDIHSIPKYTPTDTVNKETFTDSGLKDWECEIELSADIYSDDDDSLSDKEAGTIGSLACGIVDSITLANCKDYSSVELADEASVADSGGGLSRSVDSLSQLVSSYLRQVESVQESLQNLTETFDGCDNPGECRDLKRLHGPGSDNGTSNKPEDSSSDDSECYESAINDRCRGDDESDGSNRGRVDDDCSRNGLDRSSDISETADHCVSDEDADERKHTAGESRITNGAHGKKGSDDSDKSDDDKDKSESSSSDLYEVASRARKYSEDEDLTFRVSVSEDMLDDAVPENDYQDFASFPTGDAALTDNDNWANFAPASDLGDASEEFGDFSESITGFVEVEDNDEDFGDFTETRSPESTSTVTAAVAQPLNLILSSCFPSSLYNSAYLILDQNLDMLSVLIQSEGDEQTASELSTPGWSKDTRSGGKWLEDVWSSIADINSTISLTYIWNESCSNKKLFGTLNIDARNILHLRNRKQLVPLFASNLGTGVLEPTKDVGSTKAKIDDTLVDTSKPAPDSLSPSQNIPPVEFDWSTSGLTNPLESSSNRFLELNLLPSSGSKSSKVFISNPPSGGDPAQSHAPHQSIKDVVQVADDKRGACSSRQLKDEAVCDEASRIISSLPDLAFMKTKLLMFPVK